MNPPPSTPAPHDLPQPPRRLSPALVGPLALVFLFVLALFTAFEVLEDTVFEGLDLGTLHSLHLVRGFASSLLAAALMAWLLRRLPLPLLESSDTGEGLTAAQLERAREEHYARWFIRVRWIAIGSGTFLVVVSDQVAGLLSPGALAPLLATFGGLAALNIAYLALRSQSELTRPLLPVQVYGDLAVLTALLHFSGGLENPLAILAIFHVIVGGILLGPRRCYMVAGVAAVALALLAIGEETGVLAHYPLRLYPHSAVLPPAAHALHVYSHLAAYSAILLLVAFFSTALMVRVRSDERRLEGLAAQAIEQTRLLQQAQDGIVQAGKMAAVGELAGHVAHEVNNPIAIVSAKARLLLSDRRGEMSEKVAQDLAKIVDAADRVAHIAQGLLSYCRPAVGRRAPLDVRIPLRKAVAMVEQKMKLAGVEIRDGLDAPVPRISANPGEMEQIFLNLLLNAVDAMPKGGTLTIAARQDPSGRGVEIVIADTGTGIPKDLQQKVFEPFFTTKPEGRGTGLGLAICQGLVRSHGGTLELDSEPGRGTRFTLRFPESPAGTSQETHHVEIAHSGR